MAVKSQAVAIATQKGVVRRPRVRDRRAAGERKGSRSSAAAVLLQVPASEIWPEGLIEKGTRKHF